MKAYSAFLAAVCMAATAALLFAGEIAGPKLSAKELQFDFGKVAQGAEASHVFEITNSGSEQLIIERVVPS